MKTQIIVILLTIFNIETFAQYSSTTIKTPKGTNVTAGTFTGTDFTTTEKNDIKNYWLNYYNNEISYIGEATKKYNCHAYAWHVIEAGNEVWINTPEDNRYWNDTSYIEVYDHETNLKVSYGGPCYYYSSEFGYYADWCDHSAVTTSQPNYFISKWGACCLFEHNKDNCPYDSQDLHYYKLSDPVIYSTTSGVLCENVQRTFSETKFTDIDLTYDWNCTNPLTEVGDDDESIYVVEGTSQSGQGIVSLAVTTPSGTTVFGNNETVWVVTAHDLDVYCEGGEGGPVGYSYPLWVNPYYYGDNITWGSYPAAEITDLGWGYAGIYFDSPGYYTIWAYTDNSCGTGNPGYTYFNAFEYFLSPNPASDQLTITVSDNNSSNVTSNKIYEISILDMYGTMKSQNTYSGESFIIPVHNLKDGNYFVKINYGKTSVTKQLIIKH
jgi:hypothetical protein